MRSNQPYRRRIVFVVGIVVGILTPGAAALAQNESLGVVAPSASLYGKSYDQWTQKWWQWAFKIPAPINPLADPSGAHSAVGQSGQVWFLPSYGGGATPVCTIPAGKAILFPIVNVECSTVEPYPFNGSNEAELRASADVIADTDTDLAVTINGTPLISLDSYRVRSSLFVFTFPRHNVLGVPGPGSAKSVSDGHWILLKPLPVGQHTITIQGKSTLPVYGVFVIDTTYTINVVP